MLDGVLDRVRSTLARFGSRRPDLREPPVSFADGEGRNVTIRAYHEDDFESLVAMYDDFDPAQRAQGTPPVGEDAVRDWLRDVAERPGDDGVPGSVNAVAVHGDRVVGHVVFVPDGVGRHELAIFVHQDYQGAGVGTELILAGLGHARREGVENVWLTVEKWKRGAQRLYGRAGFTMDNPLGAIQRMSRRL